MTTTKKLLAAETRTAEAIVRVLEDVGIDMVFGIAGGNMGRLYDALYDHQGTIRTVLVRHEQLASVMAEVYGRLTGKPGVAIGQGVFILANGLLGTLEAHFGSSPMLLLTDFSDVESEGVPIVTASPASLVPRLGVRSSAKTTVPPPALQTAISMRPSRRAISSMALVVTSRLVKSASTPRARTPLASHSAMTVAAVIAARSNS